MMKRAIPLIAAAIMFTFCFIACAKEESTAPKPQEIAVRTDLIEEVKNLPNPVVALGYNKLNSQEKVTFWQKHVERYLAEHPDLPSAMVSHIHELDAYVSTDLYDDRDNPVVQKRIDDFQKHWYTDAVQSGQFDAKTLSEVGTLRGAGRPDQSLAKLKNTAYATAAEAATCNCYYSISCWTNESCYTKQECKTNTDNPYNCGIMGTSRCDGRCGDS